MAQLTGANFSAETGGNRRIAWGQLSRAAALAVIAAVAGCAAVYAIASALGIVDRGVVLPSLLGMGPLSLASVSVTAAVATVATAIAFGVLAVTTRRPIRNFRVVATLLAVLSLSLPATIPGPPAAMRIAMAAMHALVWVVSVGVLTAPVGGRNQDRRA